MDSTAHVEPQSAGDPPLNRTSIDKGVLAFTLAVSFVSGLLFGLVPAWRTLPVSLTEDLKQTPGSVRRNAGVTGNALIVVEVALGLILTLGAGLLLNSFVRLISIDPGFSANQVLASVLLPNPRYRDPQAKMEFYRRVIERVGTLPGVESVAAADSLPFSGQNGGDQIRIEGPPARNKQLISRLQSEASVVPPPTLRRRWESRCCTAGSLANETAPIHRRSW